MSPCRTRLFLEKIARALLSEKDGLLWRRVTAPGRCHRIKNRTGRVRCDSFDFIGRWTHQFLPLRSQRRRRATSQVRSYGLGIPYKGKRHGQLYRGPNWSRRRYTRGSTNITTVTNPASEISGKIWGPKPNCYRSLHPHNTVWRLYGSNNLHLPSTRFAGQCKLYSLLLYLW